MVTVNKYYVKQLIVHWSSTRFKLSNKQAKEVKKTARSLRTYRPQKHMLLRPLY